MPAIRRANKSDIILIWALKRRKEVKISQVPLIKKINPQKKTKKVNTDISLMIKLCWDVDSFIKITFLRQSYSHLIYLKKS